MNIGAVIRAVRTIRGLQQTELAAAAQIDPSYLSLIERGRRTLSERAFQRICASLACPEWAFRCLAEAQKLQLSEPLRSELGRLLLNMFEEGRP